MSNRSDIKFPDHRNEIPGFLSGLDLMDTWVELGAAAGAYSKVLLDRSRPRMLYTVDRWAGDRGHGVNQYMLAVNSLRPYCDRNVVLRMSFEEAASVFGDESLDFVYVDGYAHTGQDSGKTLDLWWPKLRNGGVFSGHDYDPLYMPTIQVVDEFVRKQHRILHLTKESDGAEEFPSWIIIK